MNLVTHPFVGSSDLDQIFFGDIHSYGGPDSFIALIRDSAYVITDSFHGMVFSILFHKKFVVFKPTNDDESESMNSRLYNHFKILHLESHIIDSFNTEIKQIMDSIDYISIDIILDNMRIKEKVWFILTLINEDSYST